MEQKQSEEIRLNTISKFTEDIYNKFLFFVYHIFRFLISFWWLLLLLITIGLIIGFFLEKKEKSQEATIYVQINFETANYIYDAINTLQEKIKTKDTLFLNKYGFYEDDKILLQKVEVEPIVNLNDILEKIDQDNRNVTSFLEQAQYEGNLLTSEVFIPDYKVHKIELVTSARASSETLDLFIAYLNKNPLLNEIKKLVVNETKTRIKQNSRNIQSIDSIMVRLGTMREENFTQVYVNNSNLTNIHLLYREASKYIEENQKLQISLLKYDNIVTVMNSPELITKKTILDRKSILIPVLFVSVFFVIVVLLNIYRRAVELHGVYERS